RQSCTGTEGSALRVRGSVRSSMPSTVSNGLSTVRGNRPSTFFTLRRRTCDGDRLHVGCKSRPRRQCVPSDGSLSTSNAQSAIPVTSSNELLSASLGLSSSTAETYAGECAQGMWPGNREPFHSIENTVAPLQFP